MKALTLQESSLVTGGYRPWWNPEFRLALERGAMRTVDNAGRGAFIGGTVGWIGGPKGAALGAAAGAVYGAGIGLMSAMRNHAAPNQCQP